MYKKSAQYTDVDVLKVWGAIVTTVQHVNVNKIPVILRTILHNVSFLNESNKVNRMYNIVKLVQYTGCCGNECCSEAPTKRHNLKKENSLTFKLYHLLSGRVSAVLLIDWWGFFRFKDIRNEYMEIHGNFQILVKSQAIDINFN